jgi:hypothetical protein
VGLCAVTSTDGMAADFYPFDTGRSRVPTKTDSPPFPAGCCSLS